MTTIIPIRSGSCWKSGGAVFSALALAGAICFVGVRPAEGNPPDDIASIKAQLEIATLTERYAAGVDAVGRGDIEEGRRILRTCFTDDVAFESFLPPHEPNSPPAYSLVGVDTIVDVWSGLVVSLGINETQHHVGNAQIMVQGNTATMKSYVTAHHIYDWDSSIDLITATYTDHVVRTPAGWRIDHRRLDLKSFVHLSGSTSPLP